MKRRISLGNSNGEPLALQDDELQLLHGDIEECLNELFECNQHGQYSEDIRRLEEKSKIVI